MSRDTRTAIIAAAVGAITAVVTLLVILMGIPK
jgi:hypothetical protein